MSLKREVQCIRYRFKIFVNSVKSCSLTNSDKNLLAERAVLQARIQGVHAEDFDQLALDVFQFQRKHNPVYRYYLSLIGAAYGQPSKASEIPCLPISALKTHRIQTLEWEPVQEFTSSGTTGWNTSRHLLRDADWYRLNARRGFEAQYGAVSGYCFLALLPSYLERSGSSLVFMAQDFISESDYPQSGFFLNDTDVLLDRLAWCKAERVPTILLGVSFALWDLAAAHPIDFPDLIVMETGGMKGRREELTRPELHDLLKAGFGVSAIHSEYGMTELLSQAYSPGEGLFRPADTLRVVPRDIYDPFSTQPLGQTAALNLIDLANLDTISFLASDDLGVVFADQSFQVLGRQDNSDLRGCNLMAV